MGSVVCLWILVCWLGFSLGAVFTSAGMSGDVWLIFMAASCSLTEQRPLAFTSRGYFFSTSTTLHSMAGAECASRGASGKPTCRTFSVCVDRVLLLQMGQHSFQKTKRDTTNRARPQKPTTTARRLIEMSTTEQQDTQTKKWLKRTDQQTDRWGKQWTKYRTNVQREREK